MLLFCYASWVNYHAAVEQADERIRQALDLSAEQALRVFRSISVTFDSVEQITRGRAEQTLRASEAELSERLKQFVDALPEISSIWILNAQGDAIISSLLFPMPASRECAGAGVSEGTAGARPEHPHRRRRCASS